MADTDEAMRQEASEADLPQRDLSKFLTMSDFRVDFRNRRIAVFLVTGYLTLFISFVGMILVWCVVKNVDKGVPVDPMLSSLLSGIITATFINIGAIITGYLVVPSWERNNFRKNANSMIQTVGNVQAQQTQANNSPQTPGPLTGPESYNPPMRS